MRFGESVVTVRLPPGGLRVPRQRGGPRGLEELADSTTLSRRKFLAVAVAAPVLTVAVRTIDDVAGPFVPAAGASPTLSDGFDLTDALTLAAQPTAYLLKIEITPAGRAVVHVPRAEVGQGITTAMAIVAAEELDADLDMVDVVLDDARPELLWNQLTGGSNSVHALYTPMRTVAAETRARLVTAAAQRFGVDAATLSTKSSTVLAPDGRVATYGSLTVDAAKIAQPAIPGTPKDPSTFTKIGKATTRVDAHDIVTGRAKYALDLPVAAAPTVVARAPTIGGTLVSVDDTAARGMPGVLGIARIPTGVAVAARTFEQAQAARDALRLTWNPGPNASLSDAEIRAKFVAAAPPFALPPLGSASITRTFDFAFAPHAPLEVHTCVADVRSDSAEIWYGAKSPIVAAQTIAVDHRPPRRPRHAARRARGRLVRAPPLLRAGDRSRPGVAGARPPGEADVDAQRRHAPRPHAAREPPQGPGDAPARQRAQLRPPARDAAGRLLARARRGAHRGRVRGVPARS